MFACWAINSLIATTSSQTHRVQTSPFVVYFPIKSVKCLQTLTMPLEAIMEIKVQVMLPRDWHFFIEKDSKNS